MTLPPPVIDAVLAALGTRRICRCGATLASFGRRCARDRCRGRTVIERALVDAIREARA